MSEADKEKRRGEVPFDLAQVELWKATQGLRRLDVSEEEAMKWQFSDIPM